MSINFWKLLSGRALSTIGMSLYNVSLVWFIYHLTKNTFYTGLASFLVLAPMMFQFLAGPLIEHLDKKKLLWMTELGQVISVIAAYLLFTTLWHSIGSLLLLTPVVAVLSMFSNPAEMSLIPEFVNEDHYAAANTLMNVTYQTFTIIFTSLSGLLILFLSPLSIYLLSIFFNICSILIFFQINRNKSQQNLPSEHPYSLTNNLSSYWNNLTSGFQIVRHSFIVQFLPATIVANLTFGMLNATLPAYASWRGGPQWYGFYQSAETIGILIGSALAPALKKFPLGYLVILGFLMGGCSWLVSFFTSINSLSLILYAVSLIPTGMTNILFVAALQKAVSQKYLAQIYTIMISAGGCAMPLGSLIGGQLAQSAGLAPIFISIGASFVFVSLYWLIVPTLRRMPETNQLGSGQYTIQ
ncbi:MFS transporter [Sporolactobacillus kofuensis]|uniref:MFS transporter n=1 Tax=Sporolactobacillus kofuensis TaxID=269672 RepID=A0ABW1WEW4_9BACL|nr:MFS transporter [Sporolactobacillus kofuensis]MCO7174565.1 MFS transporter [Sporolactobacillus kofuensis]